MKVLVLGNKGWIGSMMCNLLNKQDIKYFTTDIRPNNKNAFEKMIIDNKPTHIMSFIGRTHGKIGNKQFTTIDYLEQPGKVKENVRDNLFSPLVVALLAKKYNIHYTYLGTGCIFKFDNTHQTGNEDTGFNEADVPNFFGSSYSIVKGYTDELMHMLEEDVLNLRIRMPIIAKTHTRNFITKITNYEYICSMPNSMTVLDELLPYVIEMAKMNLTGTINLTNPGLITHNEILELYKKHVDPDFTWKNFSQEEQFKTLDADRSNNCLNTDKLIKLFPNILNIKDSINNILINYKL